MANAERHTARAAFNQEQRPLDPPPGSSQNAVRPRGINHTTTTVVPMLSGRMNLPTTLEELTTTPPPLYPQPQSTPLPSNPPTTFTTTTRGLNTRTRGYNTTIRGHNTTTRSLNKPPWPQIGTVLAESDIPAAWRETFEMRELRNQYFALGAVASVFLVGIVLVLALGWVRCWWRGDCMCSHMKHKKNKQRFDWYG
ncbi:hypothetical protein EJ07DRAFT_153074 [Lizonia empirigonia]|nr:hypothetical protein EJ07DRAFT_153074 [Lizonia empirigonia]